MDVNAISSLMRPIVQRHPRGANARVLLTSVFGPYAQDDEYGSRAIKPMELFHNQVTREQGEFSPRRFHGSWGIRMIQANISASCTVLDFPTRETFVRELKANRYDVVGISSIAVNVGKVREMCRLVREVLPHAAIVVGGHVTSFPEIERDIDADHIVRGEGIAWMREYLGEAPDAPIKHPVLSSGFGLRIMGIGLPNLDYATAVIIPSVGCPMGCNFCTTSAFFGGKGNVINFFSTGEELFRVMEEAETVLQTKSFSIMDENFLLNRRRAMELLDLMRQKKKSWSLHVFSSANAIQKYTYEELLELGIASLWIGLESPRAEYVKLRDVDTLHLTKELQQHGIVLMGSTIIGLEHHTPQNIREEIEHAVAHNTDYHQFMLYSPGPGTEFYRKLEQQGRVLDIDPADGHGQFAFHFEHEAISREDSKKYLDLAFRLDFEKNGPSLFRMIRTNFQGWKRHRNHPNQRVRERFRRDILSLRYVYPPLLWAMERRLENEENPGASQVRALRKEMEGEFGSPTVMATRMLGPLLQWISHREKKRLERGWTYEPPTFLVRNNWPHKKTAGLG